MDNVCPYWKLENDGCHPVICDRCFHPDVKLWGEQRTYIEKKIDPIKRIKLKRIITTTNVGGTHSYIIIK